MAISEALLQALQQVIGSLLRAGLLDGNWFLGAHVAAGVPDLLFFREINNFLTGEIEVFCNNLLGRTASLIGGAALSLLTLWIMLQGYRIVTGQSRDSMMALVTHSLRAALIVRRRCRRRRFGVPRRDRRVEQRNQPDGHWSRRGCV